MATTATPPPAGLNYIAVLQPSIIFLMIGTVWSSMLLPLLLALFFFSTKDMRRKPIFILNVVSLMLGLTIGIYSAVIEIHLMLSPLKPSSPVNDMAFFVLITFTPWLVELILLVRLLAVYPFSRTNTYQWYGIFISLGMVKLGRLTNIIIFTVQYVVFLSGPGDRNLLSIGQAAWNAHPGAKIEWILQVIDISATSGLFINGLKIGSTSVAIGSSYSTKMKALFLIAVSNFVFPVILSIVQLIMLTHDSNFLQGSYILMTNNFVAIIGVLLATVWASSSHWTNHACKSGSKSDDSGTLGITKNLNFQLETLECSHASIKPDIEANATDDSIGSTSFH